MSANNIFSIATRTLAITEHPLIRRANLGFALNQPFAWTLINAASTFLQLNQAEESYPERADQLKIKMATLRHFNRLVSDNEIGMGAINACLRPDEKDVSLDDIKLLAQDRIKIERRSGKLQANAVKARYIQLYTTMYEDTCAKKRRVKALMNEVYFICNRSDEVLSTVGQPEDDAVLVDFDAYDYLLEGLLDKCVQPILRAKDELQRVIDRSYRASALVQADELMREIDSVAKELGISWAKIDAENKALDAELAQVMSEDKVCDDHLEDIFAQADAEFNNSIEEATVRPARITVKSPERLAREAEETRVAAEKTEHDKAMAKRAAKAAATRAANKAKSFAELGTLVAQA